MSETPTTYDRAREALAELQAEAFGTPSAFDVRNAEDEQGRITTVLVMGSPERMILGRHKQSGRPMLGIGIAVGEVPVLLGKVLAASGTVPPMAQILGAVKRVLDASPDLSILPAELAGAIEELRQSVSSPPKG